MQRARQPATFAHFVWAFLIAAPLGFALGTAGIAYLPPEVSERLLNAFLVLIAFGLAGLLAFGLPRRKTMAVATQPGILHTAKVIPFRRPKHRPAHGLASSTATGGALVRRLSPRR